MYLDKTNSMSAVFLQNVRGSFLSDGGILKPGWRALFFLAPSMKNPPKVTSRVVRRSPRSAAVT